MTSSFPLFQQQLNEQISELELGLGTLVIGIMILSTTYGVLKHH
jgi:hypothetical protein